MTFRLNNRNVFDYLQSTGSWTAAEFTEAKVELKPAKNFNLLVSLANGKKLLVKQERQSQQGSTAGEFFNEQRIQQLWQAFPELSSMRSQSSQLLHFDAQQAIAVFDYLENYQDLSQYYLKQNHYPLAIAEAWGRSIANLHSATFYHHGCQAYLSDRAPQQPAQKPLQKEAFTGLELPSPEIFGAVTAEGLRFYVLYQRFESICRAIADVVSQISPCCLTHNDLKANNVLVRSAWALNLSATEASVTATVNSPVTALNSQADLRIIDWERAGWGDPAFDLGTLIASYLQLWLGSLVVSQEIKIEESLKLAMTPLERLQPSLRCLVETYLDNFPEILEARPDFLLLSLRFAGIALIHQIQAVLQYQKTFGNNQICMLQVAKSLLCKPESVFSTVFGVSALRGPTVSVAA